MFRQIELQNCIPPDLPAITADANQLSQILMNLLLNAAQATSAGRQHHHPRRQGEVCRDDRAAGARHRQRHSGRHSAARLRAVLHHQARQGHRLGTQHHAELRAQPRRRHPGGEHSRLRHHGAGHAADPAGRQDGAASARRSSPSHAVFHPDCRRRSADLAHHRPRAGERGLRSLSAP